jgi:hypothetical protein
MLTKGMLSNNFRWETLILNGGSSIDDITARQFPVFLETGLSAGDLSVFLLSQIFLVSIESSVHLAAAIGTGNCLGAPRLKFFFGRPPPKAAAPDLTVPEPTGVYSISKLIVRLNTSQ